MLSIDGRIEKSNQLRHKFMAKNQKRLSADELNLIRDLYVQGEDSPDGSRVYPRLQDLADRFSSSIATLSRRVREGNWDDQRIDYQRKFEEERDEVKRKELVNQAVEFDSNSLILAKSIQAEIGKVLQGVAQKRKNDPSKVHALGSSTLTQLANALQICHKTGRLALGESTENTNVNGTIKAKEQLDEAFSIVERLSGIRGDGSEELH